jgi:hypothetical protein
VLIRYPISDTKKRNEATPLTRSGVNPFLFADVGVEKNGMMLSVLSALSRQDIDPWDEAGRLSDLSYERAIERLAHIITAMPGSLWRDGAATTIAARLVALLPTHSEIATETGLYRSAPRRTRSSNYSDLAYLLTPLVTLALGLMLNVVTHGVAFRHGEAVGSPPAHSMSAEAESGVHGRLLR